MTSSEISEILLKRRSCDCSRGNRKDRAHVALVIEGGGMRGVATGGMVAALEEYGLLSCFDSIHGSSAGACAAAYFSAGQAKIGTKIYYEDINNMKFINPFHFPHVMKTSYLTDFVMKNPKPLNFDRIKELPRGFLNLICTDADTGEALTFSDFDTEENFFKILRGSISIPILSGPVPEYEGIRLLDGGLVQQIPIKSAFDIGATHIVALLSRKASELERRKSWFGRTFEQMAVRCLIGYEVSNLVKHRKDLINESIKIIKAGKGYNNSIIDVIVRDDSGVNLDRLTTNKKLLKKAEAEAKQAVYFYINR